MICPHELNRVQCEYRLSLTAPAGVKAVAIAVLPLVAGYDVSRLGTYKHNPLPQRRDDMVTTFDNSMDSAGHLSSDCGIRFLAQMRIIAIFDYAASNLTLKLFRRCKIATCPAIHNLRILRVILSQLLCMLHAVWSNVFQYCCD